MRRMIGSIVVSPYCPAERGGAIALGGAAKQRAVLSGLEAAGRVTLLVNSGHQGEGFARTRVARLGRRTIELFPPQLPWRPLGKLLQAGLAAWLGFRLQRRCRPKLVWVYNPYLFEALFARGTLLADRAVPLVLELEDLPLARARAGSGWVKTKLDAWALGFLSANATGATIVQEDMRRLLPQVRSIWFLPVLLPAGLPPGNPARDGRVCVGYFGGLAREKGADKLVEVVARSPQRCRWVICGAGEYAGALAKLQAAEPDRIRFLGAVAEAEFRRAFDEAEVLVNLHEPLASFGRGIFPFKLLEGVGAGKLVLSTEATGCPAEAAEAVHWLGTNAADECVAALSRVDELLTQTAGLRAEARDWVNGQFRADLALRRMLGALGV